MKKINLLPILLIQLIILSVLGISVGIGTVMQSQTEAPIINAESLDAQVEAVMPEASSQAETLTEADVLRILLQNKAILKGEKGEAGKDGISIVGQKGDKGDKGDMPPGHWEKYCLTGRSKHSIWQIDEDADKDACTGYGEKVIYLWVQD